LTALLEHGISPDMLKVVMEIGNAEAIEMAVEQGIGVAFISRLAASRGLELGIVSEVTVEGLNLTRDIYLVRSKKTPATRAQVEFWDFIHKLDLNGKKSGVSSTYTDGGFAGGTSLVKV
jgi:DNA-binding transcriptional LysR family regulator